MARPHNARNKTSGSVSIARSGAFLHWIGMLAMVVGLFAPLATVDASATVMSPEQALMKAAQQPFDRDTADFERVVLVGDFQQQLGCGAWDTNCDQTRLQNANEFWTGVFNVPPGGWSWELIAIDRFGTQYSVDDGQVNVGEEQLGIYAEFNSASRDSNVLSTTGIAFASGSFGDVALAEDGDGFIAPALNVSNDGWMDMQVTVNGESVSTGADFERGASRVNFDSAGNIANVQHLGFAEVTVDRIDADGNPLSGSCFVLDGSSQTRGCDIDGSQDGSGDGTVTLRFPGGFDSGIYNLRETRPADGAEPIADQQIDVQSGQSAVEARSEGEPEPETGDLVVLRQDQDGNPVGGACFEITNANGEVVDSACDEDGDVADDGRIGILGVPAGDYTLSETRTPEGYDRADDVSVSVFPNQVTEQVVWSNAQVSDEPDPIETEEPTEVPPIEDPTEEVTEVPPIEEPTEEVTEEPTEIATEEPTTGRIVVYREDDQGFPVGGSCFEVIDASGQVVADACDEDGIAADDGTTGIENIPAGDYTMSESRVPDGYEQAPNTPVTVTEGDNIYIVSAPALPSDDEPTEVPTEDPAVGGLTIFRTNNLGEPVVGSCIEITDADGNFIDQQCDTDNPDLGPGIIEFPQVPAGDLLVNETSAPEGTELAPQQQVSIDANVDVDLPIQTESTDVPPTDGATLAVTYSYVDGDPLACLEVTTGANIIASDPPFACDNGDNDTDPAVGVVQVENLDAGNFFVDFYQGPQDLVSADPVPVELVAGQTLTLALEEDEPELTSFAVQTVDGDNNPIDGACIILDEAQENCESENGTVTFTGVTPDEHTVRMTSAPGGHNAADPDTQTIDVAADGSTVVTFSVSRTTTTFSVQTVDGDNNPIDGACIILDEAQENCDSENGTVTFTDVTAGEHTVRITSAPGGYNIADPDTQTIDVAADGSTVVTFSVSRATTTFTIVTTDGTDPIGGACFVVDDFAEFCDDGSGSRSATVFPGEHTVTMTVAPTGYDLPDPVSQTVDVAAVGSTVVEFVVSQATVDIVVTTVDQETGEALTGACYTLDDSDPACDDDSGQVIFQGEIPGEKQLSMETAPEGFEPAPDQVIPADVTNFEVGLLQETGAIVVTIVDGDSAPLPGACVALGSDDAVCDADDGDNDGVIRFDGIATGLHSVTITDGPEGYDLPETVTQEVVVEAGADAPVTFQLALTPPATGSLAVTVEYSDGDPVAGACVTATSSDEQTQESGCADDSGVVVFSDLLVGTYSVTLQDDYTPDRAVDFENMVPATGEVLQDGDGTATLYLPLLPTTGSLEITALDSGVLIEGACFTVDDRTVCDNESGDTDRSNGVVLIEGLDEGTYNVSMSTVPSGYQQPANQEATITVGATTPIEFQLDAEVVPGSLTVSTMNSDDDPLTGACYSVVQGGSTISTLCDRDPADGEVTFEDLPAGTYQLTQTRTPGNQYQAAPTQTVQIAPGENTLVEIVMDLRPGQLRITTVDSSDTSIILQNACYRLAMGDLTFGPFCDADDGNVDGVVRFGNLPSGVYELEQTVAAAGYETADNRNVTINPAGTTQITVRNAQVQPPDESGTLVVIPMAPNGEAVAGGCYQVFDGDTPLTQRICDNADDQPARITFENLPVGDLTLREALAPSPDWQIAADIDVTIRNGETTTVEVPHEFKRGHVVIQAVNTVGLPLQGACFALTDAGDIDLCTDSTGQATVSGLAPGTRELTQTEAPFGYRLDETPREVTVRPGQTTTVRVVFQNEPPPNTGTVQVQKFYCPAGEDGERTRFLGGAQGNQELKQTVGCEPGIATFTLEAEDGSTESNAEFQTNEGGRAQLTAVEGIYLLTETDPDMPGNSAARIRVGTGQMTTVIVINYVAPPAPAPVTINVEGYTCPPGFNGTSFVDFQNSCMANSQLTNQITVRAEAENRYKRVTGDAGELGKTSFVDLPSGTYNIWAERPHTVPVNYLFCGADVNSPNQKAVNGSVSMTLESGSTILCRVFQVPPLFDAEHGAIQVQKYNCPINERQRGFDYENECERASEPVQFEIVQLAKTDGSQPQPVRVSTNSDGIVQFPMLLPGTYKLTEVEGEWCFAQSNSVDAQGDVVVQKDKLSEVWVYNCVGTKAPPNTGSGDAAGPVGGDGGIAPMQVLPNLLLPTVLLAGWMIWRDRKQA